MSKKGFTLVEIIVTVGLLAVAAIVVTVNIIGMSRSTKVANYGKNCLKIEEAAKTFINLQENKTFKENIKTSGSGSVTVNQLICAGLIPGSCSNDPCPPEKCPPLTDPRYEDDPEYEGSTAISSTATVTITYVYEATIKAGEFTFCFQGSGWNCTTKEASRLGE